MNRTFIFCFIFCFLFFCLPVNIFAQEDLKSFSFAESLYENGDYYRAISEYKRFIFYFPEHPLKDMAQLKIGYAYKTGNKFDQAVSAFRKVNSPEAKLQVGESFFEKMDYIQALKEYQRVVEDYPLHKLRGYAEYKSGWAYTKLENYSSAAYTFKKLADKDNAYSLCNEIARQVETIPGLPHKSPELAGLMSAVLPGAGQVYTERVGDGTTSFILNGLFIWGAIESYKNKNHTTTVILALFETGWYFGGIYNAVSNAHKYNRRIKEDFIKKIESSYRISLNFSPENREPVIEFKVNY